MILVFKTSVKNKMQVKKLKPHIDKILPRESWNFDLDDCDKILRVESETIPTATGIVSTITDLLNIHNHSCEELE